VLWLVEKTIQPEELSMNRLRKTLSAAVVMAACVMITAGTACAGLTFGVTPSLSDEKMHDSYDPILAELSVRLGEKVTLYIAKDYSDLSEKMRAGLVDIGAYSPFAYVEAADKAGVRLFAILCVDGKSDYKGVIITRKDRGIRTVAGLGGKKMAFVDPKSASGFIYPRAMLVKLGYDPDVFFKDVVFEGSHDKVIDAVMAGNVEGGAAYDGALRLSASRGVDVSKLAVLVETAPIPYDAYTVKSTMPEALYMKIRTFFLGLDKDKKPLKTILAKKTGLSFSGWIPGDDSRYDVVRETAAYSGRKKRIAVWGITTKDRTFEKEKINEAAAEMLSSIVTESGRFTVVQGGRVEEALFSAGKSLNDRIGPDILALLLKEEGVDVVLAGSLESGKDRVSLSIDGYDTRKREKVFSRVFDDGAIENLDRIVGKTVAFLMAEMPLEAYVIGVKGRELTLNTGSEDGVKYGMRFEIINPGDEVKDLSGRVVERKKRKVGEGRFLAVTNDTATGEVTDGDPGQIDVGSRVRVLDAGDSDYSGKNRIYASYIRGLQALARGEDEKAVQAFRETLDLDPGYAMAHARLSTALFNRNMRADGFEELEKARALLAQVTFQERNYILAREATERGNLDGAAGFYEKILEKYPRNTSALHNLGLILARKDYKKRNVTKAKDCFRKALEADPDASVSRKALNNLERTGDVNGSGTRPVDVVVVFDTTGSMSEEIDGMIRTTGAFADILRKNRIDFRLGLVSYGDEIRRIFKTSGKPEATLTKDADLFKRWLKSLNALGGDDEPENTYEAVKAALGCGFRKESKKVLIVITDAPPHAYDDYTKLGRQEIGGLLEKADAALFMAAPDIEDYRELSETTGGKLYDINGKNDFSGIIRQIGRDIAGMY
jgi:phosphate/phosphite/phosphonate ABC transporter binding protein